MIQAQLPVRLVELLRRIDSQFPDKRELTLGPVTFKGAFGATGDALVDQLIRARWGGMPTELLPFAMDAMGNRFCLVMAPIHQDPEKLPVVYWMYETGVAVPVASCFDRFLDWIGLASEIYVRRGSDDQLTREHLEQIVRPQLRELGVERDFFALTTSPVSPVGSLHLGTMRIDPSAPGSRLVAAKRAQLDGRQRDAILHARQALKSFPTFLAAAWFLVTFPNAPSRVIGYKELVRGLVDLPLAYRGDPLMPEFGDIPSPSPNDIAELVQSLTDRREIEEDSLLELMVYDDPQNADVWLAAAIELANFGHLQRAHVAVSNALHLAREPETRADVLSLMRELYDALGWTWNSYVVQHEIARLTLT